MNIFSVYGELKLKDDEFNKGMDGAVDKAKSFGGKAKAVFGAVAKTTAVVTGAVTAVGGAFVGASNKVAEYGDHIDKMSQKVGMSAEGFQKWDYVFQRNGANIDSLQMGMKTLSQKVENGSEAFQRLGLSQAELANMNQEEIFGAVVDKLSQMEEGTERASLATELLGRTGAELAPMLNAGSEEIEHQKQLAEELGMVLSQDAVTASANFEDSLTNLKGAFGGVQNMMVATFLPSLTEVMDGLTMVITGNDEGMAKIEEGINSFVENMTNTLPKVLEIGTHLVTSLSLAIIDNLPTLMETGANMMFLLIDKLIDALPQILETGLQIIITLADGIADNVDELIPRLEKVIMKLIEVIIDNLPKIIETGLRLIGALAIGLIKAIPDLVASIPRIIRSIRKAFSDFDWGSIGRNIIDGVKDGIVNAGHKVIDAITGIASNAFNSVKNFFGIASPSKKMKALAKWIPIGMADGIDSEGDTPIQSLADISNKAIDEVESMQDKMNGLDGATATINTEFKQVGANGKNGSRIVNVGDISVQIVADKIADVDSLADEIESKLAERIRRKDGVFA